MRFRSIVGVDLAGPSNQSGTAAAAFLAGKGRLTALPEAYDGSDRGILELVRRLADRGPVAVGLDAPLSYEPGGGQRERDRELRKRASQLGLKPGSVMTPTLQRMVYLTLRGLAVARLLSSVDAASVVEVHPGACLALSGAPVEAVREFAARPAARKKLLGWLSDHGLGGIRVTEESSSHEVAACAAALAAWKWAAGKPSWLAPAEPPWHPYGLAC